MNHPHQLATRLLDRAVKLYVIGCGGTGAAFASGLPYLHQAMLAFGHPAGLDVTLIDGDLVSETNSVRQPFSTLERGRPKATVLASRLNSFWGTSWTGIPEYLRPGHRLDNPHVVVGCVDTREARRTIQKVLQNSYQTTYWLDAGNDAGGMGQVVLGQTGLHAKQPGQLPTIAELFPQMVDPKTDVRRGPSCSAIESLTRQAPFTNHVLAHHMLFLLGLLFRQGGLNHHGYFFNLEGGIVSTIRVDPAQWEVINPALKQGAEPAKPKKPRKKKAAAAAA